MKEVREETMWLSEGKASQTGKELSWHRLNLGALWGVSGNSKEAVWMQWSDSGGK